METDISNCVDPRWTTPKATKILPPLPELSKPNHAPGTGGTPQTAKAASATKTPRPRNGASPSQGGRPPNPRQRRHQRRGHAKASGEPDGAEPAARKAPSRTQAAPPETANPATDKALQTKLLTLSEHIPATTALPRKRAVAGDVFGDKVSVSVCGLCHCG